MNYKLFNGFGLLSFLLVNFAVAQNRTADIPYVEQGHEPPGA